MKKKKGFTLVELVIVIAVIAVLAAVLVPTFITVINSANDSADTQLAANLNTALADGQAYPNEVASAQNIRNHVRPFGYEAEDLVTKNKKNVIAYNKNAKRVESLDVSKIDASALIPGYYAEEVIDGYIIFSTGGNELSEALYAMQNLPDFSSIGSAHTGGAMLMKSANSTAAASENISATQYFNDALNKISNADIRGMVATIVQSTIYVDKGGNMFTVDVNDGSVSASRIETSDIKTYKVKDIVASTETIRSRVVFSNSLEKFDIVNLMVANSGLSVIIPQTLTITNTYEGSYTDMPVFTGNLGGETLDGKALSSIDAVKALAESNDAETIIMYTTNAIYTSDYSSSFNQALSIAQKMYNTRNDINQWVEDFNSQLSDKDKRRYGYKEIGDSIVLIIDSNVYLNQSAAIPGYLTVEIPFARGTYDESKAMVDEAKNKTSNPTQVLCNYYPTNDPSNATETASTKKTYYLCGGTIGKEQEGVFSASKTISAQNATYTLTIQKGCELTVEGQINLGGVIGSNVQDGYQGHTSGKYSQIDNKGTITVKAGGAVNCFGFIKGDGTMTAKGADGEIAGASICEPFVITDYMGAFPTMMLYPFMGLKQGVETTYSCPFSRYSLMNIQNTLTIEHGATLYGRIGLTVSGIGSGSLCWTYMDLIGPEKTADSDEDAETFILQMGEGSKFVCRYDEMSALKPEDKNLEEYEKYQGNKLSLSGDIGKTTVEIYGNVSTGPMILDVFNGDTVAQNFFGVANMNIVTIQGYRIIDSTNFILPVPFNYEFIVKEQATLNLGENNKYTLMPGASLTVENNAQLVVKKGAALYVPDATHIDSAYQSLAILSDMDTTGSMAAKVSAISQCSPRYYPSAKLLEASGMSASAILNVNGTFTAEAGSFVGGIVNSNNVGAKIVLAEDVDVSGEFSLLKSSSAMAAFDSTVIGTMKNVGIRHYLKDLYAAMQCDYVCPLRILTKENGEISLTAAEAGKTYNVAEIDTQALESVMFTDNSDRYTNLLELSKAEGGVIVDGNYKPAIEFNMPEFTEDNLYKDEQQTIQVKTICSGIWSIEAA